MISCDAHSKQLSYCGVTLISNFGGVLFAVISAICIATNTLIQQSLRCIFFSFSVANVIGTCMLIYGNIALVCNHNSSVSIRFVIITTMILSASHLFLLILMEYVNLKSLSERRGRSFVGLVLVSWIMSMTLGGVNVVTSHENTRLVFAVLYLFFVFFISYFYFWLGKHNRKKINTAQTYERTFLRGPSLRNNYTQGYWKLKFLGVLIFSYMGCSISLIVDELWETSQKTTVRPLSCPVPFIIYSLNFYFPSAVCIYLSYKQWMSTTWDKHNAGVRLYMYTCGSSFITSPVISLIKDEYFI